MHVKIVTRKPFLLYFGSFKMSHSAVTALCRAMKLACELYPSRDIAVCLDPYCGLGFLLWCLTGYVEGNITFARLSVKTKRKQLLWPVTEEPIREWNMRPPAKRGKKGS